MLKFVNISNLAVIHRLNFELHEGLNLLTGETGAGKSIIVDALVLMLGGRGGNDMVRTGERVALIEGVFELPDAQMLRMQEVLQSAGVNLEAGEDLLIRREIHLNGRNRIFVNDQNVTTATLRKLQPALVEILGQGEQHALTTSQSHLEMLDDFAGCEALAVETAEAYGRWRKAVDDLQNLERDASERERLGDYLRYQISEIEKVNPGAAEETDLLAQRTLLVHAERALELCAQGYADLYESDGSVLTQLSMVRRRVQDLNTIDSRTGEWLELIESANALLSEVAEGLRGFGERIDFTPERLSEIESRLAELERLKRKYGREIDGVIRLKRELQEQLDDLGSLSERVAQIKGEVETARSQYLSLAQRLSGIRRAAAPVLEDRVLEELSHLAMERARFIVSIETAQEAEGASDSNQASKASTPEASAPPSNWGANGIDRVEFLLSANVGESPKPLQRVASGGELSRLMLALRTVCQSRRAAGDESSQGDMTLVFDEVDTGIGGRTAEAVGRRLKALAVRQQVLCVTHQAQIARFADHHYAVSKHVEAGRTLTVVQELQTDERIGELARMIGGSEDVETARAAARWMLEQGESESANRVETSPAKSVRRQGRKTVAKTPKEKSAP